MDMKQLEAFACVAEQRSFSKAARLLHLTQPTVSARVASLEQELQIQLLQRPSAIPSEAGELLYHYAGQMLALRTRALDALQGFSREMRERSLWQLLPSRAIFPPQAPPCLSGTVSGHFHLSST